MACSLCGVPGFGRSCSAHTGTESQTHDGHWSKQVRAASMTSKDVLDKLYSTPYNCEETIEDLISKSKLKSTFGDEIIEITKTLLQFSKEGNLRLWVGNQKPIPKNQRR